MSQLIWKELRENLKWGVALLAFLFASLWFFIPNDKSSFYFEQYSNFTSIFILATASGFVFGLLQIIFESAPDRWAFLIHRSCSPTQIALSKATVGVSIQLFCWIVTICGFAWYLKTSHTLNHPFYWFSILPALFISCTFIPAYFCGLFFLIWKPRWKITRLLILSPFLLLLAIQDSNIMIFAWTGVFTNLLILLIASSLGGYLLLGCYRTSGEFQSGRLFSRLFLSASVALSLFITAAFTVLIIAEALMSPPTPDQEQKIFSTIRVGRDGKLYKHEAFRPARPPIPLGGNHGKLPNRHELSLFDDPESIAIVKEIPDNLPASEILDLHFPQLVSPFSPRISPQTVRVSPAIGSKLYRTAGDPLVSTSLIPIHAKWPRATQDSYITAHFSQITGLIHLYEQNYLRKFREVRQIGRNGSVPAGSAAALSLGHFLREDQGSSVQVVKLRGDDRHVAIQVTPDSFLIVCTNAIYQLSPLKEAIELVYEAPEEDPIVDIGLQETNQEPLLLIEHQSSFKVFTTNKSKSGSYSGDDTAEKIQFYLYTPAEDIAVITKPEYLHDKKILQSVFLREKDALFLEITRKTTNESHPVKQRELIELNSHGEVIAKQEIQTDPKFLEPFITPSLTESLMMVSSPPFMIISMVSVDDFSAYFSRGTAGYLEILLTEYPRKFFRMTLYLTFSIILSTLLGQWYCNRKQLTPSQKRLTLLTTLLCGPSGLAAIWFMESPPHREKCQNCGKLMSVVDQHCRQCGAEAPLPPSSSTDILSPELYPDSVLQPIKKEKQLAL